MSQFYLCPVPQIYYNYRGLNSTHYARVLNINCLYTVLPLSNKVFQILGHLSPISHSLAQCIKTSCAIKVSALSE